MPTEIRPLIFSISEVVEAVTSHNQWCRVAVPSDAAVGSNRLEAEPGTPVIKLLSGGLPK